MPWAKQAFAWDSVDSGVGWDGQGPPMHLEFVPGKPRPELNI